MTTTGRHRGQAPVSLIRAGGRRRSIRMVLRSVLLAGTVFTLALVIGVLLSAAAPAELINEPTPAESAAAEPANAEGAAAALPRRVDGTFARSMIFSGLAALGVSIAGTAMVLQRRRQW
jgi:hypothetical protein